ncbi:leucine-rich repeat protein [Butyrivibrio sp. AE3004]|uniref:leucine-rich repeat protein n=1 Tax=Butyrivibrio sp. AE3004 TaxID=1506994 RepID=UPI00068C3FDD|nr:leucine-rich repeat protein [Butyrivibrio sp. AE3004]
MSFKYEKKKGTDHSFFEIKGNRDEKDKRERVLCIPEKAEDENGDILPVEVIGNHAFSSRKDIEEIVIPDSIHTILGFAFHNCSNLKKIKMADSVTEYLDGSTRQCENLTEIEIDIEHDNFQIIRRILEDNDRRLTFRMHLTGGDALLVFPGFNYDFVENTMARTIQFAIEGTGYAYRECVKSGEINFREYDNMFPKASADDSVTAEMIAMARLAFPYELTSECKDMYEKWLLENAKGNLKRAIENSSLQVGALGVFTKDAGVSAIDDFSLEDHFDFYMTRKLLYKDDAKELAHMASDKEMTAIVSMMMNFSEECRNDACDLTDEKSDDGFLELDF